MQRIYNFGAGPGMMPEEVLKQAQAEMLDWHGLGVSIMEVGHRGPEFKQVAEQAEANLRELMNIPKNYHVIFTQGGATGHFSMVPLNLLGSKKTADYVDTGIWSQKAIAEAKRYGTINIAAQVERDPLAHIPKLADWKLNPDAAYLHYTPNETIDGIEFNWVPDTQVPLVADMSSMIMSREIDVSQYGVIYAGAQKNMGQAGIAVAIIREDLVQDPMPMTPILYNYKVEIENKSLYNTPATYPWYFLGLVLEWMKSKGGVKYFAELNQRKAKKLYAVIDGHKDFYINKIAPDCRSQMNVVFDIGNPDLLEPFLQGAKEKGLAYLRGHRMAGGVRASIYNPMPMEGVEALAAYMQDFAAQHA